jgi:hypothetical protein
VRITPKQTPRKSSHNEQRDIVIARNMNPVRIAELPPELQEAIQSRFFQVREDGVSELARLLEGRQKGPALAAQQALEHMAEHDDSRRISNLALEKLKLHYEGMPSSQQPTTDQPTVEREPAFPGATAAQPAIVAEPTPVADEPHGQIQEEKKLEEEGKQELLKTLYETGLQAMEVRDWKENINAFQEALDLDPGHQEAARHLNFAREEQRKAEAAVQDISRQPAARVVDIFGFGQVKDDAGGLRFRPSVNHSSRRTGNSGRGTHLCTCSRWDNSRADVLDAAFDHVGIRR